MLAFALILAPARRQPEGLSAPMTCSHRVSGANIYFYLYSIIASILLCNIYDFKILFILYPIVLLLRLIDSNDIP